MLARFSRKTILLACSLGLGSLLAPRPAAAQAAPADHLWWAEDLVLHITPELNAYGSSPSYVYWAGVGGATQYENRTLCTTFVTILLKHAYGHTDQDFRSWFGSTSPNAVTYHDTILLENGFLSVTDIADIQAGDLIAIAYPPGGAVTGHIAIARAPAAPRLPTAPLVAGAFQYEIAIADSTSSAHGPTDTRRLGGIIDSGAGFGVMRLYADEQGNLVGHTWSTSTGSTYYDMATRHVAVGRLL